MRSLVIATVAFGACHVVAAEERHLGITDRGIFGDLDDKVVLPEPADPAPEKSRGVLDPRHHLLVVWIGDRPVMAYPAGGQSLAELPPQDRAEVERLLGPDAKLRVLGPRDPVPGGDADDDGIPDELDIVLGAHKVALNAASYVSGYVTLPFPGGDVPRDTGVCTDVVVRALRNAGIDLQKELYLDIGRAPAAYPMVKRRDPSIDQRRVKTLLPWFQRHFTAHAADPRKADDPYRPGDILFMDTAPRSDGPEHMAIVSDHRGPSGMWLVVNNWTTGYRESEMDLLPFVPVLYRFRVGK